MSDVYAAKGLSMMGGFTTRIDVILSSFLHESQSINHIKA